MAIRIVLVDDHPLVLEGLESVLIRTPDVDVVGRCQDGAGALEVIEQTRPDLVVLDAAMPGMSGVDVMRVLAERKTPVAVVLLASTIGAADLLDAVRLGVSGIVLKDEALTVLPQCVRAVSQGGRWLPNGFLERALRVAAGEDSAGLHQLTNREIKVAEIVAEGLQNKEVAVRLGIASGTVRIHLRNIFQKLDIHSRVQLANQVRASRRSHST